MKRTLAVIGMLCATATLYGGVAKFNDAHSAMGVFKGLFWMVIASGAFIGFSEDFRKNRWPFFGGSATKEKP